jgi:hypothetical protein
LPRSNPAQRLKLAGLLFLSKDAAASVRVNVSIVTIAESAVGQNASVELSWHVGFTPDSGRTLGGNERGFGPITDKAHRSKK